jgi:hypothetical protein
LFKMLLELLDLLSHFIHFKSTNVPLKFLHMSSMNNHGCKIKALILIWYQDGMKIPQQRSLTQTKIFFTYHFKLSN